jgi:hypothetical protein
VLLTVQENKHGRVGDIVETHVTDAHSVRRGGEVVLLAKKVTLMEKRRRRPMRRADDNVRDTRFVLALPENVISSSVEIDKGNVLTVAFPGFALAEKGNLDEVIELLAVILAEEYGKYARPALHVRKRVKDGVDSLESHFVVAFVRPVKVDDVGPILSTKQVGNFLIDALVSSDRKVSFSDIHRH